MRPGWKRGTLHRLLEVAYDVSFGDTPRFRRNAEDPLEAGVVIVDEASMLDLAMFDALLQACADGTRLILVGDAEQLPSVGAGRVLGDLIDCGILPVTRLRQVFRQSDGSRIAANAQGILEGRFPEFSDEYGEFHLVRRFKATDVAQTVVRLCRVELPERYGFDPYTDIQVLSPMRKGAAGVENLNRLLQEALNPPTTGRGAKRMVSSFREGDRVMQNRNDYRLAWTQMDQEGMPVIGEGVYNGDMGTLIEINPKTRISTVLFDDGRQAEYGFRAVGGSGTGLCGDRPQEPGQRIPGRGPAARGTSGCARVPESAVYGHHTGKTNGCDGGRRSHAGADDPKYGEPGTV